MARGRPKKSETIKLELGDNLVECPDGYIWNIVVQECGRPIRPQLYRGEQVSVPEPEPEPEPEITTDFETVSEDNDDGDNQWA